MMLVKSTFHYIVIGSEYNLVIRNYDGKEITSNGNDVALRRKVMNWGYGYYE
jgi:hypothetical protein